MRVKRGKFETNNYSLIVLKCLDDDGQKRPEDIKKVKEMLCFAFAKMKTRIILEFMLMQRGNEIGNFTF